MLETFQILTPMSYYDKTHWLKMTAGALGQTQPHSLHMSMWLNTLGKMFALKAVVRAFQLNIY